MIAVSLSWQQKDTPRSIYFHVSRPSLMGILSLRNLTNCGFAAPYIATENSILA